MTTSAPNTAGSITTENRTFRANVPSPLDVLTVLEREYPDTPVIFHDTRDEQGHGAAMIGVGRAIEVEAESTLDRHLSRIRTRLSSSAGEACDVPLFFHLGFNAGFERKTTSGTWAAFGQRSVTCPQVVFRWDREPKALHGIRLAGLGSLDGESSFESDRVDAIVDRSGRVERDVRRVGGSVEVTWPGVETYRQAVAHAIEASQNDSQHKSALEKVVIARTGEATQKKGFSPTSVLASLDRQYGTARVFALAPSGLSNAVFVGASPERLIESDGEEVRTMALAGTREREAGQDPDALAEALMESSKDRAEHGYVTRMIGDTLRDLGGEVDIAETPTPMVLANVIHLETPISARFGQSDPPNLGQLVEALHPTPAVCGTPTDDARAFIREHEGIERGLYTGVLGWQNADGGGDTTVALRCGLIDGQEARIFAGGGVTADSDVDAELRETSAKFEPMLQALRRAGAPQ
jgi:isochorismate synthase